MSAEAGSVFDVYRQRVERPVYRLFTTYGPGRLKWMTVGMIANVLACGASLLPPLLLEDGEIVERAAERSERFERFEAGSNGPADED